MKVDTFKCDVCGIEKKDANHWWKAFALDADADGKPAGIVILAWDINAISKPLARIDLLPAKADAHLCGENHVFQWVSEHLTKVISD